MTPYGYCHCGCGEKTRLAPKTDRSCGWVKGEPIKLIKHHRPKVWANGSRNPTHISWQQMLARTKPGDERSQWYAEKGIGVCERWRNFDLFVEDMGLRPDGTTLDRMDGNRGYEPGNCKWATKIEQASNLSSNRYIEFNGERHTLAEWGRRTGFGHSVIRYRLERGWASHLALSMPPKQGQKVMA